MKLLHVAADLCPAVLQLLHLMLLLLQLWHLKLVHALIICWLTCKTRYVGLEPRKFNKVSSSCHSDQNGDCQPFTFKFRDAPLCAQYDAARGSQHVQPSGWVLATFIQLINHRYIKTTWMESYHGRCMARTLCNDLSISMSVVCVEVRKQVHGQERKCGTYDSTLLPWM